MAIPAASFLIHPMAATAFVVPPPATTTTAGASQRRRNGGAILVRPPSSSSLALVGKSSLGIGAPPTTPLPSYFGAGCTSSHGLGRRRSRRRRPFSTSSTALSMSLVPVPLPTLRTLLRYGAPPSPDQYATYLGRTPRERYDALFEGASVALLGTMFAYFTSFVIGQFLATILGVIFLFWTILSPELKAYQRNWELIGGRDLLDPWTDDEYDWPDVIDENSRGLYGAYYFGRIDRASVVDDSYASIDEEYDLEEFHDYRQDQDKLEMTTGIPWKIRLNCIDDAGREMQVHARMSEEYLDVEEGMPVAAVLLSSRRDFGELAALTDFCVVDYDGEQTVAWVGDYPYLERGEFERTLADDEGLWRLLTAEGRRPVGDDGYEFDGGVGEEDYYPDEYDGRDQSQLEYGDRGKSGDYDDNDEEGEFERVRMRGRRRRQGKYLEEDGGGI